MANETFQVSEMGDRTFETKNVFDFFIAKLKSFFLILPFSVFFLYDLFRRFS